MVRIERIQRYLVLLRPLREGFKPRLVIVRANLFQLTETRRPPSTMMPIFTPLGMIIVTRQITNPI